MRRLTLVTGVVLLCAVWMLPWPLSDARAFSAHMLRHMTIVVAAAPLLAMSVAGTAIDPVSRRPRLFAPVAASFLELLVVWIWHTPALHVAARHHAVALVAEQASFLLAAFILWISVLGGSDQHRSTQAGAGVIALLLTSMHMTLLGALLALTPRVLYGHPDHALLAALEDQHLGGAIMLLAGGASYLFGGLWLIAELLRSDRRLGVQ